MQSHFSRRVAPIIPLLLFCILALGVAVARGWLEGFDLALSNALHFQQGVTPNSLITVMQAISWIGGGVQRYVLVTILAAILWWWIGKREALAMAVAALASSLTSTALKYVFMRPRPDMIQHLDVVTSPSYPSGHSTNAAVVYLLLALIVPVKHRALAMFLGVALTLVTGISRVNLGVHWPTDVLGGWMLGAAFALGAAIWVRAGRSATERRWR